MQHRSVRSSSTALKSIDMFRKIPVDLQSSSSLSSPLSLFTIFLMFLLLTCETIGYLRGTTLWEEIELDTNADANFFGTSKGAKNVGTGRRGGKIIVEFNFTLLDLPCDHVEVDLFDDLGTRSLDLKSNIEKWKVDGEGKRRQYAGRNKAQNDVLHDHDNKGDNNLHGTLASLHADGVHAIDMTGSGGKQNFVSNLKKQEYAFVDFYAPWCIWCQRLEPAWERLGETVKHEDTVIGKVDCEANAVLCREQGIKAYPTLRMFQNGEKWGGDYRGDRTVNGMQGFLEHVREETGKVEEGEGKEEKEFKMLKKNPGKKNKQKRIWNEEDHPGCMVVGYVWVNKIPGRLQLEAKNGFQDLDPKMANLSHTVNKLTFGTQVARRNKKFFASVPEGYKRLNTMDGNWYVTTSNGEAFHHFVNVVPTRYKLEESTGYIAGTTIKMIGSLIGGISGMIGKVFGTQDGFFEYNQMSHSSQKVTFSDSSVPTFSIAYDIDPLIINIGKRNPSFWSYVVKVMAIVGGVYTVLNLVDRGVDEVNKKMS